ncbi:MAG: universal stress protein [Acidimicrobiia bacterium]|nr:universal stress protein [Acidimicrobiia bacterium]
MRSIIVGYIDTPAGHAALERALEEAKLRSAQLVIVNSMYGENRESDEEYIDSRRALDAVEAQMAAKGVAAVVHQYVRGQTPAQDLCRAAEEFDAELIVIGTRRRTATGKILLGSNALEILHDAPCPVLCIRVT